MFLLSQVNPAIILYVFGVLASFYKKRFQRKSPVQGILKFLLFAVPILVLFARLMQYHGQEPYPFILRKDWFNIVLYGDIDKESIFLGVSFLIMLFVLAVDYLRTPFSICLRTVFLMSGAIGMIFAKDAMSMLFYFELTSLVLISNVLVDRGIDSRRSFFYAILHIFGGSMLLAGLVAMVTMFPVSEGMEFVSFVPIFIIVVGMLVFIGMPPFAFTIVDTYGSMDFRNLPLAVAIVSKMVFYILLPLRMNLLLQLFPFLTLGVVFYVSSRVFAEKSLTKVLIMSSLTHSATTMYFFSFLPDGSNQLISFWLSVNMLATFYIFSVLRLLHRFDFGISTDIKNLSKLKGLHSPGLNVLFAMAVLTVFGTPGSLLFFSKEAIRMSYQKDLLFSNLYFASKALNFLVGWKLVFSYFGFWRGEKRIVNKRVSYKPDYLKMVSLLIVGIFILTGGMILRKDLISFFGLPSLNSGVKEDIKVYFGSVFACGVIYACLAKFFVPTVNTEDKITILFRPIKNTIVFLYEIMVKLAYFAIASVDRFFIFYRRSAKFILKKAAIGVFSKLYSSELVLCMAIFMLVAMFVQCIN